MKKFTIGVFLNLGESFTSLSGQAELMLQANILPYAQAFDRVYIFTYAQEKVNLPANCYLVTPPFRLHRYIYTLILPFMHRSIIKQCNLLRCFQLAGTLPALISKLFYGSKFVFNYGYDYAAFAGIEGRPLQAQLFSWLKPIALKFATGVIVKNKDLPVKGFYLPNGVDINQFHPPKRKFHHRIKTVLYVGRLEPQKNLIVLLTALAQVKTKLKIVIVGQGSQSQKLLHLAKQLKLNLVIKSPIAHSQLPKVYRSADLFVLPSLIEGSPKVLLEAMASNLPIVATNVPGSREIIKPNTTGILVEPTVADLGAGINQIFDQPSFARRLGQAAHRQAIKQYNQKKLMASEITFLQSCAH